MDQKESAAKAAKPRGFSVCFFHSIGLRSQLQKKRPGSRSLRDGKEEGFFESLFMRSMPNRRGQAKIGLQKKGTSIGGEEEMYCVALLQGKDIEKADPIERNLLWLFCSQLPLFYLLLPFVCQKTKCFCCLWLYYFTYLHILLSSSVSAPWRNVIRSKDAKENCG